MEDYREREREEAGHATDRRFYARPKICQFCADKNLRIDYKNVDLLKRYVTEEGKIRPRRQTGTCARHQRALAVAVKRARHIALLPFVSSGRED
ncbi:MAG: 30S ribosomal protein S18 [Anaerolineales bacterium]|nr:30S ribosomal protein S18 [Anaerolineales bacterium]MCX7755857.1 30S ribosomal protein S18 [Anaerolineales bacterium]MDW8277980.1 30S ribosomal protein S18 [Anaerolineales bacterium]